jgi:signal transduction histidine kinase/ActR/RegA family two-component response regulator
MPSRQTPIRRKLMTMILLTSGAVLLLTSASFVAHEFLTFRYSTVRNLSTLGQVIATNSTAALAFDNAKDAAEILTALKAEPHVVSAGLYDSAGQLFATYPQGLESGEFPPMPGADGYRFEDHFLVGFQPVLMGQRRLGALFLKSDLGALFDWLRLFGGIAAAVIAASFLLAYLISRNLQRQISEPILALAQTAATVSRGRDYSVRAAPAQGHELRLLTDGFNHMLERTQAQLSRLDLLQKITRAIGERQDPASIFQVVLQRLEDDMPIEFGCICLHEAQDDHLSARSIGAHSVAAAAAMGIAEQTHIPIDDNGISKCLRGQLVYEPDVREVPFPLPQRLAAGGFRSLVIAPLLMESDVFGMLIASRREADAFTSGDCEFLRQVSEHVALATQQAQLYSALQRAYDDLRQSQQTALQQERLRALGQMASGIAHDINNAISPVALYTESLLEREPNLSERTRSYLVTIQRAIEDVAETVARMREFYRPREPQIVLGRIHINRSVQQIIELTRARWSDVAQQRGIMIELRTELADDLPELIGAESEVRDALTNLIFNAVDAMPNGGILTLRTSLVGSQRVCLEVSDTGLGMGEETRRRCLEPFYTTKGERGTGLGLAMVYGMIQRHSAELEIDSELGKGTTMRLIFTLSLPDTAASGLVPVLVPPQSPLRILLVDDDPILLQSLRDTLEGDGHSITAASGGQAGIDAFTAAVAGATPFDVVVTDLGMPYVDGRKVAAKVRAVSPTVPIVMLTGWGQRLVADDEVPPHVDRVLNKPPRLAELREILAELTA